MMCDTSLTYPAKTPAAGPHGPAKAPGRSRYTALTSANAETPKVIKTARPAMGAYPQFGPVVDLAYTRRRATW